MLDDLTDHVTPCGAMPRHATPPKDPTPLSQSLAAHRTAAGLRLDQVAAFVGAHHRSVRRWERGETAPGRVHLDLLAIFYNTTVAALLAGPRTAQAAA